VQLLKGLVRGLGAGRGDRAFTAPASHQQKAARRESKRRNSRIRGRSRCRTAPSSRSRSRSLGVEARLCEQQGAVAGVELRQPQQLTIPIVQKQIPIDREQDGASLDREQDGAVAEDDPTPITMLSEGEGEGHSGERQGSGGSASECRLPPCTSLTSASDGDNPKGDDGGGNSPSAARPGAKAEMDSCEGEAAKLRTPTRTGTDNATCAPVLRNESDDATGSGKTSTSTCGSREGKEAHSKGKWVDVTDDEPAGLMKTLIASGLAEGMSSLSHAETTPADQKCPPSNTTAVGKEAVVQKGKQAPKNLERGENVTGSNVSTKARVLRAKLFGEIHNENVNIDICESEPAMELIKLVGRTEAGAIFEEVLEAQIACSRQRLLKVNPNKGNRVPQPRKRYA
jgi:hypothetical protein